MGMVAILYALTRADHGRLLASPEMVLDVVIDPEDVDPTTAQKADGLVDWVFRKLGLWRPLPPVPPPLRQRELDFDPANPDMVDLDKSWHGIHYLLTGSAEEGALPLAFLVHGGTIVGEDVFGYGPPRAFSCDETKAIWQAMAPLTAENLRQRFDPRDMHDQAVYPDIWLQDPETDDSLGYCLEYYEELRAFLAKASERDRATLVVLQ